jgi:DNA-directed RNA polymerase subunit RPC12/RpoP
METQTLIEFGNFVMTNLNSDKGMRALAEEFVQRNGNCNKTAVSNSTEEILFIVKGWRHTDKYPCPRCGKKLGTPDYKCHECNIKLKVKVQM